MNNVFKPIKYLSIIILVIIISAVITYIINPIKGVNGTSLRKVAV